MSEINVGLNIKKIRLSKDMTQKDVADLLGITQSAYAKFEKNNAVLRTDTLIKIANTLNVNAADLLSHEQKINENIRREELKKRFDSLSDNAQEQALNILDNLSKIDK